MLPFLPSSVRDRSQEVSKESARVEAEGGGDTKGGARNRQDAQNKARNVCVGEGDCGARGKRPCTSGSFPSGEFPLLIVHFSFTFKNPSELSTLAQGEDPTAAWIWTVVRYYVQFFVGILGLSTTILWLLHMVLFMFTPLLPTKEPIDPFLNTLLIDLDQAFPLFGTTAFAAFCLHMLFSAIKVREVLSLWRCLRSC